MPGFQVNINGNLYSEFLKTKKRPHSSPMQIGRGIGRRGFLTVS